MAKSSISFSDFQQQVDTGSQFGSISLGDFYNQVEPEDRTLGVAARDIALEEGFLRSATDLALLRIQALIEAEDIKKATDLHQEIRNECAPFAQREGLWQNLKKEIIAKS